MSLAKIRATMATIPDLQEHLERIDRQLLALLEERVDVVEELKDQGEEMDPKELEEDMVAFCLEEAVDRGLDEGDTEKVMRAVNHLRRAA
ncbi:MAG: chorismate mutase [Candidatus Peregrinibacteria bacterium]